MKTICFCFLVLSLTLGAISCTQAQLDTTARDAQMVKNLTTQPVVRVVAAATDPLTGGASTGLISLVSLGASVVLNVAQTLSHASTKKTLAVTQTLLAAGVQATTPATPILVEQPVALSAK